MVDERAINHAIARQINPEIVPSVVRQRPMETVRTKFMVLGNFYSQLPHNDGQIPTDIWQAVELPLLNKGSIKLSYVDALGKEEMLTFPAVEFSGQDKTGEPLQANFILLAKDAPQPEKAPSGFSTLESLPLTQLKALADHNLGEIIDLEKLNREVTFYQNTLKTAKDSGFMKDDLEQALQRQINASQLKLQIAQALMGEKDASTAATTATPRVDSAVSTKPDVTSTAKVDGEWTLAAEIPDMDVELTRLRQAAYNTVTDTLGLMEAHSETLRKGYGEKFFPDRSFALARFDPEQMAVLPEIAMEMIDAYIANKKLDLNKEPLKSHLESLRRSMETYVQ